ncbi:hypothetical protein O1C43_000129 [Vibrio cholerae]|nr:hypothetical protein [Vibrio cholerae]
MNKEKIEQLTKLHMSSGVIEQVIAEMVFQDMKWGESRTLNNHVWDSILSEEVGEVSEEAVLVWNAKLGIKKGFASKFILEQETEKLRSELIQVAAVAIQWIEAIDRDKIAKIQTHKSIDMAHQLRQLVMYDDKEFIGAISNAITKK